MPHPIWYSTYQASKLTYYHREVRKYKKCRKDTEVIYLPVNSVLQPWSSLCCNFLLIRSKSKRARKKPSGKYFLTLSFYTSKISKWNSKLVQDAPGALAGDSCTSDYILLSEGGCQNDPTHSTTDRSLWIQTGLTLHSEGYSGMYM